MSEKSSTNTSNTSGSTRETYAEAFDRSADPLAKFSDTFHNVPDPFEYYLNEFVYTSKEINKKKTIEEYRRTYRHWKQHMEGTDRHPACPSPEHVSEFIEWRRDVHENSRRHIQSKLNRLIRAYESWQEESSLPHPPDFNPFELARDRTFLGTNDDKDFPDPSLPTLQSEFAKIENIRNRAIIGTQLKEGCRRGEICNLQLPEIHVSHNDLLEKYPELGNHPALEGVQNAMYIPSDRDGNKSSNPRLLPIDEELRWLLIQHLIKRPQVDNSWVFLSETSFSQLGPKYVNDIWKKELHPKFAETDDTKAMTSHFGRHKFTTHWRLNVGLEREKVQYMRGDFIAPMDEFPSAIDDYLHPNYNHIERIYRNNIFKLDLPMRHYVSD